MKVSLVAPQPLPLPKAEVSGEKVQGQSFGDLLKEKLQEVNKLQSEADALASKLMVGEQVDLHQVMIAAEQANLALQLTVQIRNKIIEAYQEISRMQI